MICGASHSFALAKSFPARPSGICCYWQAFLDLIHSPSSVCFFSHTSAIRYQSNSPRKTIKAQTKPTAALKQFGLRSEQMWVFPIVQREHTVLSGYVLYEVVFIFGCFAKCQKVVINFFLILYYSNFWNVSVNYVV